MAISKEVQKSSEMKFDGKLIKVTYDIADVNGNEAWREVVHHPGGDTGIRVAGALTETNSKSHESDDESDSSEKNQWISAKFAHGNRPQIISRAVMMSRKSLGH